MWINELCEREGAGILYEKELAARLVDKGFELWAHPAGASRYWPDIGASKQINGDRYNLYFEAKSHPSETFATLSAWKYESGEFRPTPRAPDNDRTELLIELANRHSNAREAAEILLEQMRDFFDASEHELPTIHSGMLRPLFKKHGWDKDEIQSQMKEFADTHSYQLTPWGGRAKDPRIGKWVREFYVDKFHEVKQDHDGKHLVLLVTRPSFEMFRITNKGMTGDSFDELYEEMDVSSIPRFPTHLEGMMEIRVSPRYTGKIGTVDMKMSLRLPDFVELEGTPL